MPRRRQSRFGAVSSWLVIKPELYDGDVSDQAREVLKTLLAHGDKINAPENALLKRRLGQL